MNFVKQPFSIDIRGLVAALGRRDLWGMDRFWKDFPIPIFREVDTIYLRFPDKAAFVNGHGDVNKCYDQPAMDFLPEARQVLDSLAEHIGGVSVGRLMINKVDPAARILPHSDGKDLYYSRYHLVLQTNDDVYCRCGNEEVKMRVGETWWFNHSEEHEVINNGTTPRIHLVADFRHE